MKRRVVLIRHAKSSWANPLQSDFDRKLNDRGLHDAPMMGQRLKKAGLIPDCIISSPAKRAAQTAKRVAAAVGYPEDKIEWQDKLYHCISSVFEEVVLELDDTCRTAFIVAHNPGITDFANELAPGFKTENMPTCALVGMELKAAHWSEYHTADRQVFLYDYPKKEHGL